MISYWQGRKGCKMIGEQRGVKHVHTANGSGDGECVVGEGDRDMADIHPSIGPGRAAVEGARGVRAGPINEGH